jgi:hypothetical protein
MSRHERRRARAAKDSIVHISFGRGGLLEGVPEVCFACGKPAPAWPWPEGGEPTAHGVVFVQGAFVGGRWEELD